MNRSRRFAALAAALAPTIGLAGCFNEPVAPDPTTPDTTTTTAVPLVKLSGNAYRFNQTNTTIDGAEIRFAEFPDLVVTTGTRGYWEVEVPKGTTLTPYIVAADYNTIYLQTFRNVQTDIVGVNFQTPHNTTYAQLNYVLTLIGGGVAPNANGCAIVSTIGVPELDGMPFETFRTYNPHGIAGATAQGISSENVPAPAPVYFNSSVVPDPAQVLSSDDGGVVWMNVPEGTWTFSASHPDHDFATFEATCVTGRVINANPTHGLRALN